MEAPPTFEVSNLLKCSTVLRGIGEHTTSMEEVALAAVGVLRRHFVDKQTGDSALPLVRFYITQRSGDLEPALQDFARAAGSDARPAPDVPCLTLLASAGEEPAWNDRRMSEGHRAIPLPSVAALHRLPMVAQLVEQLGLDPRHIIEPDPALFHDLEERTYNVFFVPEARDSPFVPAQDGFVIPYGIRSVVGFGGVLPNGVLFAAVLFSKVHIPASTVDAFAAVAVSLKVAVLPHVGGRVFADQALPQRTPAAQATLDLQRLESRSATLSQLLDVRAGVVDGEALRLERNLTDAEERIRELEASHAAVAASEARLAAIIDGSPDCVIGMDSRGFVTDFNRAAQATFGYSRGQVVGLLLADVIVPYNMRERHRLGLADVLVTGTGPILDRRIEVNALRRDGSEFAVEVTVTRVPDTEPPLFVGYVRDITPRRQAAAELVASRERLAHIARTLQTSLLPPTLPEIEGIELAAAFHALGDGYEVGGDFYDAFQLNAGTWALTLGDVCGKGSEAAVLTALARYTLRAAAMRRRNPAAVLGVLNEAVLRQHPGKFCTAVFATLEPGTGLVEVALGGHPHPLLLTSDGEVTAVGTPGALLGPFARWQGSTDTVVLGPGDGLLFYSDGVTEARSGAVFYGEERLVATLKSASGLDAAAMVRRIESDVLAFAGRLSDDLAILAVRRPPCPG